MNERDFYKVGGVYAELSVHTSKLLRLLEKVNECRRILELNEVEINEVTHSDVKPTELWAVKNSKDNIQFVTISSSPNITVARAVEHFSEDYNTEAWSELTHKGFKLVRIKIKQIEEVSRG